MSLADANKDTSNTSCQATKAELTSGFASSVQNATMLSLLYGYDKETKRHWRRTVTLLSNFL
jgi:hypothetical protein